MAAVAEAAALQAAGVPQPPAAAAAAPPDSWLYITPGGEQRGPLPGGALLRLVERGVLQVDTMVWRPGEAEWLAVHAAPEFRQRVALVRSQFYIADSSVAGGRAGPYNLAELRRRFDAGEIDGMSPVWYNGAAQWAAIAEVGGLRGLLVMPESGAGEQDESAFDTSAQVFERDEQPALPEALLRQKKKSFVADDGRRFGFDGAEWVEMEGDNDDDDDDEEEEEEGGDDDEALAAVKKKTKKKKDGAAGDEPAKEELTEEQRLKAEEKKRKRERKKQKKKTTWDKVAAKSWIYIEGIPLDTTVDELKDHFSKVGVIALDPETQEPKVKIYRDEEGHAKGDASVCYANAVSVDLALQILDGGSLRFDTPLKVSKAEFGARLGAFDESKKRRVNMAKVRLAKKAQAQELEWANDEDSGATAATALRIIVVKNAFAPADLEEEEEEDEAGDGKAEALRTDLVEALDLHEPPEKLTIFAKHQEGVVVLKFRTPGASSWR